MTTITLEPDTGTAVDLELLEHLDHDWAVPCEMRTSPHTDDPCGQPADWWLICRQCGHAIAECEEHRAQEHAHFSGVGFPAAAAVVGCLRCLAIIPAPAWASLFIVEPIGVRS